MNEELELKYLEIYDAIEPYISIENYNLKLENGRVVGVFTPQVTTLFVSTKLDERIKSIDLKLKHFFLTNESRKYFEHLSIALKNKQYYQMCYDYYEAKLQEILVKYKFEKINPEKPCSFSCNDLLFINFSIRNILMNDKNKAQIAKVAKDERFKDFFHKRTRFEETIYLIESVTEYLERLNFVSYTQPPKITAVEEKKGIEIVLPPANKNNTQPKLIVFNSTETIENLLTALKGFFPEQESELEQALQGKQLNEFLIFPHNQNKFVEVFKRAKYNNLILSTPTEIKNWICLNFNYTKRKGKNISIEKFSTNSVWDILTKDRKEPKVSERICKLDWLPYKNHNSRKKEKQKEKL